MSRRRYEVALAREAWRIKRLERLRLESRVVDRALIVAALDQLSAAIRDTTRDLEERCGLESVEVLWAHLDDWERGLAHLRPPRR